MKAVLSGTSKKFKKAVSLVLGLCMVCALTMGFGAKEVKAATPMKISIMGDSISSFYNPGGYHSNDVTNTTTPFYPYPYASTGVDSLNDTCWMKVANSFNAQIMSNDSIGASRVANYNDGYAATYFDQSARINDLGNTSGSAKPDTILLFGGTNDACITDFNSTDPINYWNRFTLSYADLVDSITRTYGSDVQIYCITPYNGWLVSNKTDHVSKVAYSIGLVVSQRSNCHLVDLSSLDFGSLGAEISGNGHPNAYGMEIIAQRVISAIRQN